jgi:hypothetical protein
LLKKFPDFGIFGCAVNKNIGENLSRLQGPGTTVELSWRKGEEIQKINVKTEKEK